MVINTMDLIPWIRYIIALAGFVTPWYMLLTGIGYRLDWTVHAKVETLNIGSRNV